MWVSCDFQLSAATVCTKCVATIDMILIAGKLWKLRFPTDSSGNPFARNARQVSKMSNCDFRATTAAVVATLWHEVACQVSTNMIWYGIVGGDPCASACQVSKPSSSALKFQLWMLPKCVSEGDRVCICRRKNEGGRCQSVPDCRRKRI